MLLLSSCGKKEEAKVPVAPSVQVVNAVQKDVPIISEWIGSLDGSVNATVRAQVTGYLIKQNYKEGTIVKTGNVLFEIDPRPFEAAVEQARAQLSQAQAHWQTSTLTLNRMRPLAEKNAVAKKDLDNAIGAEQSNKAQVDAAKAVLDKAIVDLGFTKVLSPVDGMAGSAKAQIGDLAGTPTAGELTTVSSIDPMKVYVEISEREYLGMVLNNTAEERTARAAKLDFDLYLANGALYSIKGKAAFADREVKTDTGTIRVAILFGNPNHILKPGMSARVKVAMEVKKDAVVVPQRAVAEVQGQYSIMIVSPENKAVSRSVKMGTKIDNLWVVESGINPGDNVIVEGWQKVRDGMPVTPVAMAVAGQ